MSMLGNNKKTEFSSEEMLQQNRDKTAQQWIPIADIDKSIVYRKDNLIISMIRVQPENIDLLSDREQRRKVELLTEAFNGQQEAIQIWCVGRPVDLNNYLDSLQEKAKQEHDFTKKNVLKGYIQYTSQMASSGDTVERRFYIIIKNKNTDKKSVDELIHRTNEFQINLTQAELTCNVCYDDEIMDVYTLFANPVQAAFEKAEILYDLPPLLS